MNMDIYSRYIQRVLNPIKSKIQAMACKAIINAVKDSTSIQLVKVQGLDGEVMENVERLQNYGFSSKVPPGGEAFIINTGANKDHPVAVVVDYSKGRKKDIQDGEVAVYHKDGSYILFKSDKSIEISSENNVVIKQAGNIMLGGDNLTALDGVVTGECLDPVTGVPFPDKSSKVLAAKV